MKTFGNKWQITDLWINFRSRTYNNNNNHSWDWDDTRAACYRVHDARRENDPKLRVMIYKWTESFEESIIVLDG